MDRSPLSLAVLAAFGLALLVPEAEAATRKAKTIRAPAEEPVEMPSNEGNPPIVRPVTATDCLAANIPNKPYYVEFRARTAASYGHTFVLHGLLGANGFRKVSVAGLHPKGDDPVVYTMGHLIPVAAETGASWGDLDEQYLTTRYCVRLSADEYGSVLQYIRQLQATKKTWLATGYNCNSFAGDIARFMGMRAPMSTLIVPESYINSIRELNGGRREISSSGADAANIMPRDVIRGEGGQ